MGRHSIPDPEDSAGEGSRRQPPTERSRRRGNDSPTATPTYRPYGRPDDDRRTRPRLPTAGYGEAEYDAADELPGRQPTTRRAGLPRARASRVGAATATAAVGTAARRRLGRRRMDGQPPRGHDRPARRQPRRHRRAGRPSSWWSAASSCGDSSATRCPTAPKPPPRVAWTARSRSRSSPTRRSPSRSQTLAEQVQRDRRTRSATGA